MAVAQKHPSFTSRLQSLLGSLSCWLKRIKHFCWRKILIFWVSWETAAGLCRDQLSKRRPIHKGLNHLCIFKGAMAVNPKINFGNLITKTYWGNEGSLKSDLLQDGWQPQTKYRPSASVIIGSFIDFRACRHAWGDLLFENNCSIRGFIQAPAGYLRHYYCPIRIPKQ